MGSGYKAFDTRTLLDCSQEPKQASCATLLPASAWTVRAVVGCDGSDGQANPFVGLVRGKRGQELRHAGRVMD